jgi:hypothetical protein
MSAPRRTFYHVTYARCVECISGEHVDPPTLHTWLSQEDASHYGTRWPVTGAALQRYPCACRCAGNNGPHEPPNRPRANAIDGTHERNSVE